MPRIVPPKRVPNFEIDQLNEWSLEFMVMTELKELAESIWWYIRPITLRTHWSPGYYFPIANRPRFVMYKPAPAAENGLGYDIQLKPLHNDSKSLLLQFKRHKEDKNNPVRNVESKFYNRNLDYPAGHYEFHINDNKSKVPSKSYTQHRSFKELVKNHGSDISALYALPRIKNKEEMERFAGKLLLRTQFLSVQEIDLEALYETIGGNPMLDWTRPHRILINELGDHWELNYYYYFMRHEDKLPSLITDLVMLNLSRSLTYLENLPDSVTERAMQVAVAGYLMHLMSFCGVGKGEFAKHKHLFEEIIGLTSPIDNIQYEATENMDESMRIKGIEVWKNIASALNLIVLDNLWSPRIRERIRGYKFQTISNMGRYYNESLNLSFTDESLSGLSAYSF